ncbi:MAG: hypothetical protein MJ220_02890 [Bacilli bacterium]|nr:hypothetical protein [Bacilli bacterium]
MTVNIIQSILKYRFKNTALLERALTRKTYSAENGGEDNESLEFVGDSMLNCAVTIALVKRYGISKEDSRWKALAKTNPTFFNDKEIEEVLTEIRSALVCKLYLANRATEHKIHNHIRMGKGDIKLHMEQQDSVKEDLLEALIGAIALDSDFDMPTIVKVVEHLLYIDRAMRRREYDPKERFLCRLLKKVFTVKGR